MLRLPGPLPGKASAGNWYRPQASGRRNLAGRRGAMRLFVLIGTLGAGGDRRQDPTASGSIKSS
jgi:hypothetical protein